MNPPSLGASADAKALADKSEGQRKLFLTSDGLVTPRLREEFLKLVDKK